MNDRFTTIAGWVLFAGIVGLGASLVSGEVFKGHRPETMGYPIEGVVVEGEGGAAAEKPIEFYLASADPVAGEQVFKKCAACHNADNGGANQLGPNLWGVLGEPIGKGDGGSPSPALRAWAARGTGQPQPVAGHPKKFAPGNQDDLRRPEQARDRANVIAS